MMSIVPIVMCRWNVKVVYKTVGTVALYIFKDVSANVVIAVNGNGMRCHYITIM